MLLSSIPPSCLHLSYRVFTCCVLSKSLIRRSLGQGLSLCPLLDLFSINPFHTGSIWKVDSSQILIKYPINKSKSMLRAQHRDNAPFRCCMKSWCWYHHLSEVCIEMGKNLMMSTRRGLLTNLKKIFIYLFTWNSVCVWRNKNSKQFLCFSLCTIYTDFILELQT